MVPTLGWAEKKMGLSLHSKAPLSLGDGRCGLLGFPMGQDAGAWETGLRERASLVAVHWRCPTGHTLPVTRKHRTGAIAQHRGRVTDFTVRMPRTPLNLPPVRQMKLPLYFATLQVTETQLLLLLLWFHPPEFRQLRCLSELPVCSLCSTPGVSLPEPAGQPFFPELTYLNVSALPGRPSSPVSRAPMLRLLMRNWPEASHTSSFI